MLVLLTISVILLLLLYVKLKYFTLRGPIPGLSPHFLFGNLIQSGMLLNGKPPPAIFAEFKSRYGDIYQFWFGPTRYIVVSNVNDIQHIFTHRHIYDQGKIFIEQFSILFPSGYGTLTG
ncbi:unnamed protein product [Rotaria sp. Silwood2]|nr:unnamed protein product [Rotaria sp. Silwood2]CAF3112129.1 unnamed protein product [Rotaria sp. Silwood2]CAF3291709.1 unnamed protein product [Rotaria sp. Silwood2]CAF3397879.1 unnamed protein product [Rotaria sp. Silwood2]CAF4172717.1 unnamed protein product [Rotaria sp. Silwood2]